MSLSSCISRFTSLDRHEQTKALLTTLGALAKLSVGAALLAGCSQSAPAPALANAGSPGSAATMRPGTLSIAETLKADPRFSDFVRVIDFAGLGHRFDNDRNMTVFAPTNAAFDNTDPDWRTRDSTGGVDSFDVVRARQERIEQTTVTGIHPPADFIGKLQDVETVGGRIFRVNGLMPGAITVTVGVTNGTGIGFPVQAVQTVRVGLPPIRATDGLIYPIDVIMR